MIGATNSWLVAYDNLSSGLPGWLNDALCVVSTGGGMSTRELYTDSEEALLISRGRLSSMALMP